MQKTLMIIGALLFVIGFFWPFIEKLGLGRLPGDVIIHRGNTTVFFPIATMIIVSIILTLIARFLGR